MYSGWGAAVLCSLLMCNVARTSVDNNRHLPNLAVIPGSPITVNTNDPGVLRATRFGIYKYNNRSNDIYLFKELHINKAMLQVVRGLKYKLDVDICRTVCNKRTHHNLDQCGFQRKKTLRQVLHSDVTLKFGLPPGYTEPKY